MTESRARYSVHPERITQELVVELPYVREAMARGFISLTADRDRVVYRLHFEKHYVWSDPEEWVRCATVAFLVIQCDYSPNRIDLEVPVPRRVPGDYADIVVFRDDRCRAPYLVVENKPCGQSPQERQQAIEQAIGNAHSLRADFALFDEWIESALFDTSSRYPSMEREENRRGTRDRVPKQYSDELPRFRFIARDATSDIAPANARRLENKVRRTHSIIWSGGKRDPLTSFDEWSKLLFAKVHDERTTQNGQPRRFQIGGGETATAVANRIHQLFWQAADQDRTIFPEGIRIALPDNKIRDIVEVLQDISIVDTDADTIGRAFERFFGTVFRGELGQYFTMRQICRFSVAAVGIDHQHYIIDPAAGSGGFLLEALLQCWRSIERDFAGQSEIDRRKYDFAMHRVYGIEIHDILSRILKINLLLHHDGHTNVEGDRSCLDVEFVNQRLRESWRGRFDRVIGNPPFGDTVKAGDRDHLGVNSLDSFELARGRSQVPSEHLILERGIDMLRDGGKLAFVIPDGLLNNQGEPSNCPALRRLLARRGRIEAIVSLPDYAFRKSGAQNKTSILFFRKFRAEERAIFNEAYSRRMSRGGPEDEAILNGLRSAEYQVFLAEAKHIGYTSRGSASDQNDLYVEDDHLSGDQAGSILGEMRRFQSNPGGYDGHSSPDCMAISIVDMWQAHASHRLDPKYFLFKLEERQVTPPGWIRMPAGTAMRRRAEQVRPEERPDDEVTVLTVSQSGELRPREAGKGRTPPEWRGMYFTDIPTTWYTARSGDVVFSGIDLWKGCIAVVTDDFDGALVSSEFPVYEIIDNRLDPAFLSTLLRSRYYRRAFRAITTGHSNRRRTQPTDFEALEICFPADRAEQRRLVRDVVSARESLQASDQALKDAMLAFSDLIDHRGDEAYEVEAESDTDSVASD